MKLFAIIAFSLLLFVPIAGTAATYYVDPEEGDDSRPGTSRTLAWKHIPGSRREDNSGFVKAAGWTRIGPGDTILIKSGGVIRNGLVVDPTYYTHGTQEAPIRIVRDVSWASGPVVFDGRSQLLGRWDAMILVWKRDYVEIDGITANGVVVRHAEGGGIKAAGSSEKNKMVGLTLKNMRFYDNLKFNVVVQRCDGFLLDTVEVDGNRRDTEESGGFHIGGHGYGCSNGRLINCRSYNNGDTPGSQAGGTDARIGFWLANSTGMVFENCVAHDNEGDGFDAGVEGSPPSVVTDNIRYMKCLSYNNADGFGCNLDDIPGAAKFRYINCVSRGNNTGWNIYEGPAAHVLNCLASGNRCGIYIDAPKRKNRMTTVEIRNTVFSLNSNGDAGSADLWIHRADSLELSSDYNHFEGIYARKAAVWDGAYGEDVYRYTKTEAPGSTRRSWYRNHGQDAHSTCRILAAGKKSRK